MTPSDDPTAVAERRSGMLLEAGLRFSALILIGGLAAHAAGRPPLASALLAVGLAVLVALPALPVVLAMGAFIRLRDWRFVAVAAGVIALLVYNVGTVLW